MVENGKNLVQSAAKVFAVLRAFDPTLPELTISEVAARAGLDRGTAFRLIHTLVSLGYLCAVPTSKRFRLTLKCLELGYLALASQDLPAHAAPLLRECVPALADAGSLAILDGPDVVYLERVQSGQMRQDIDRRPGRRIPVYAAAIGQVQLAYLPQPRQVALLESVERVKLSERTLTDLDALLARLRDIRARGYAVSDGENAYGLRTVAAPVLDATGSPIAGISFTIDAARAPLAEFVAAALPAAQRIAGELSTAVRLSAGAISVGATS
ncbi:Helix-turn-helix domain-containing protein [Rhodovastum atsumiense]|uniref:Helix-turn-helix domain-containing protein n=1 Tax=Rhodovastum atsumiense TaxID=504468 RepID=A0A5M6IYL6_9PROT|nr:IclR family transcriptional regulator C-terminal domain-containing protein [Rhodovastum atsumiense]KAA5613433.1 helix-turn-helix domain-containing protein [Rhodovastum atsumiense]CAH2603163.1 Helix-turn-helix domain-containing protein [Rhodovastum atsumiense]